MGKKTSIKNARQARKPKMNDKETQEYIEEIEKNIRIYESDIEYHERKLKGLHTMMRVCKDMLNNMTEK